jgi:hypothetical protein
MIYYHYEYGFTEGDVFVGIRVFGHEGIGCGKLYTVKDCDSLLLQDEGLNETTVGELRMVTSTLQEDDVARERASGQGPRLLRGEEHKDVDVVVGLEKQVKKNDVKVQKEQATVKDTSSRSVGESGVMLCRNCVNPFMSQKRCSRSHEQVSVEQFAIRASKRETVVLRPAEDLAQDQVHSAASLNIGQGNVFRGQDNRDLFFPKTMKFFPAPRDVPVVKEVWVCKGVKGMKGVFKKSKRDFLVTLFNNNGGTKIRERPGRSQQDGDHFQGQG